MNGLNKEGEKMFCGNCGIQLKEDVTFCPSCGKRLDGQQVVTGTKNEIQRNDLFDPTLGKPANQISSTNPRATIKTHKKISAIFVVSVTVLFLIFGITYYNYEQKQQQIVIDNARIEFINYLIKDTELSNMPRGSFTNISDFRQLRSILSKSFEQLQQTHENKAKQYIIMSRQKQDNSIEFSEGRKEAFLAQEMAAKKYQIDNYQDGVNIEKLQDEARRNTDYVWKRLNDEILSTVKSDYMSNREQSRKEGDYIQSVLSR